MESLFGKKMCLFFLVFVALFAKLSSQKIIQVVDESSYYDYEGSKIVQDDPGLNTCRYVQLQCTYRGGCGSTLQNFAFECDDLIHNRTQHCSTQCKNTLVGLMSTPEGQKMIKCDCEGDPECEMARRQIDSCRASVVYATRHDTVVSCTEAQWICMADTECAKALEYYNFNCRAMFRGKRCSQRCKNSLTILSRQRAATKLADCRCEFNERIGNYQCTDIKRNMGRLCDVDFRKSIQKNIDESKRAKQEEYILWESTSVAPPEFDWPELVVTEIVEDISSQVGDENDVDIQINLQGGHEMETEFGVHSGPGPTDTKYTDDSFNSYDESDDDYEEEEEVTESPEVTALGDSNEIPLDYSVDDPETMENEVTDDEDYLDNGINDGGQSYDGDQDVRQVRGRQPSSSSAALNRGTLLLLPSVIALFAIIHLTLQS